ncbi:hypothetical protein R1flu_002815 [Riccia fluitans]|uniref:Uncharacterized protein n=1 Tax=Riccia fluitans TaxID=41844 RepID=A0ABD1Y7Q4_9MARC
MLKRNALAGNKEAAFVVKPVLLGGSLQQRLEQRVTEIVVIDHLPPPLLSNIHHQTSCRHVAGDLFRVFIILRVRAISSPGNVPAVVEVQCLAFFLRRAESPEIHGTP